MDFLWTIHPRLALTYCGGRRPWPNAHAVQVIRILHPHRQPAVSLHTQRQRPLLMAAGFAQTNLPVPWLGRKWLQLIFG
jgi:hypothetical protein